MIELISKIKPKNNGEFALVDAHDIEVENGKRLDEALEELAASGGGGGGESPDLSKYATKDYVDDGLKNKVNKVDGKGLSEKNYTAAEQSKLAGIEARANYIEVDGELKDSTNPVQNKAIYDAIIELKQMITNIGDGKIQIVSFTCTPSSATEGDTVEEVTLKWACSKTPTSLKLNGFEISANSTSHTFEDVSETTDYTLEAYDGTEKDTETTGITFRTQQYSYYGLSEQATVDDNLFNSLTRINGSLQKNSPYIINTEKNKYIYFISATSFTNVMLGSLAIPVTQGTYQYNGKTYYWQRSSNAFTKKENDVRFTIT